MPSVQCQNVRNFNFVCFRKIHIVFVVGMTEKLPCSPRPSTLRCVSTPPARRVLGRSLLILTRSLLTLFHPGCQDPARQVQDRVQPRGLQPLPGPGDGGDQAPGGGGEPAHCQGQPGPARGECTYQPSMNKREIENSTIRVGNWGGGELCGVNL